jgi:hypothetical protein
MSSRRGCLALGLLIVTAFSIHTCCDANTSHASQPAAQPAPGDNSQIAHAEARLKSDLLDLEDALIDESDQVNQTIVVDADASIAASAPAMPLQELAQLLLDDARQAAASPQQVPESPWPAYLYGE